jgi:hypothetical protein
LLASKPLERVDGEGVMTVRRWLSSTSRSFGILFLAFWRNDLSSLPEVDLPLWVVLLLVCLVGVYRQIAEILGGARRNYYMDFASLSNTIFYSVLLVFLALPLLSATFGRSGAKDLRNALYLGVPFLFFTFSIVPLVNTVFNYNFSHLPTTIRKPWIPGFLYVATGAFAGFVYIIYKGTRIFSSLSGKPIGSAALRVTAMLLVFFLYTYVLSIALTWGTDFCIYHPDRHPGHTSLHPRGQFYSLFYTVPLLPAFPILGRRLRPSSRSDDVTLGACFVLTLAFTLVFLNNALAIVPGLVF